MIYVILNHDKSHGVQKATPLKLVTTFYNSLHLFGLKKTSNQIYSKHSLNQQKVRGNEKTQFSYDFPNSGYDKRRVQRLDRL